MDLNATPVSRNPADYPRKIQLLVESIAEVFGKDLATAWDDYFAIAEKNAAADATRAAAPAATAETAQLLLHACSHADSIIAAQEQ